MRKSMTMLAATFALGLLAAGCPGGDTGGDDAGTQQDAMGGDDAAGDDATGGDAGEDGGGGDASDTGPLDDTLTLDFSNSPVPLPKLSDDYQWEGWLVGTTGPQSTGKFKAEEGKSTYQFQVSSTKTVDADRFVLSIEPKPDDDPSPSNTKFLSGELGDSSAELSITGTIGDFSGASGAYTLNAPTADDPSSNRTHGIWFLQPGESPSAGFEGLPDLADKGWAYEGWVVDTSGDSPTPYTTGKFADASESWTMADRDGAGPSAGPNPDAAPDFPGSDYVGGGDAGNDFDLTAGGNWNAVLSVEPQVGGSDTSPDPFPIKPFSVKIQSDTETQTAQTMNLKSDQLPTGSVEID